MSKAHQIGAVIANAIDNTPALSAAINSDDIYLGLAPAGVMPCITLDGIFAMEDAKTAKRNVDINLWFASPDPANSGLILDIADALRKALEGTAIQTSAWVHMPDAQNNVDRVRIPSVVYLNLL